MNSLLNPTPTSHSPPVRGESSAPHNAHKDSSRFTAQEPAAHSSLKFDSPPEVWLLHQSSLRRDYIRDLFSNRFWNLQCLRIRRDWTLYTQDNGPTNFLPAFGNTRIHIEKNADQGLLRFKPQMIRLPQCWMNFSSKSCIFTCSSKQAPIWLEFMRLTYFASLGLWIWFHVWPMMYLTHLVVPPASACSRFLLRLRWRSSHWIQTWTSWLIISLASANRC